MVELVNDFIGKDCIIYTMNDQFKGTIKDSKDGWISIDNGKTVEIVNLDYIIRIREYIKKNKNK